MRGYLDNKINLHGYLENIGSHYVSLLIGNASVIITILVDIFKVDGGDSVVAPGLPHVASQAPLIGFRAELQDLVIVVTIIATWI